MRCIEPWHLGSPWVTFEGHFGYRRTVITLYARLTRAVLAIAKFLVENLLPADCASVNTVWGCMHCRLWVVELERVFTCTSSWRRPSDDALCPWTSRQTGSTRLRTQCDDRPLSLPACRLRHSPGCQWQRGHVCRAQQVRCIRDFTWPRATDTRMSTADQLHSRFIPMHSRYEKSEPTHNKTYSLFIIIIIIIICLFKTSASETIRKPPLAETQLH